MHCIIQKKTEEQTQATPKALTTDTHEEGNDIETVAKNIF